MNGTGTNIYSPWHGLVGKVVQIEWDWSLDGNDHDSPLMVLSGVDEVNGWAILRDKDKLDTGFMAVPLRFLKCIEEHKAPPQGKASGCGRAGAGGT